MEDLNDLYKRYCHLNDGITNGSMYYDLLQEKTSFEEVQKLFPYDIDKDERERRKDLEYLYLWDVLFYREFVYREEFIWRDENHKNKCISNVRALIQKSPDEYLCLVIFRISSHWPELRDLFYSDDKKALENCDTKDDYRCFIEKHPNTFKEYLLFAKYKYCKKSGEVFTNLNELLRLFPHSELIDVEEVKSSCRRIGYIYVMFNEELSNNDSLKECISNYVNGFMPISSTNESNIYISEPLSIYDYIQILQPDVCHHLKSVVNCGVKYYLGTYQELESLINRLSTLTCVRFEIPKEEQVKFVLEKLDKPAIDRAFYNFGNVGFWCKDMQSNVYIQSINGNKRHAIGTFKNKYALFLLVTM